MGFAPVEGSQFPATFGHMMGGYDAGYYGYLWSKVYAMDMFTVFEKNGLLDTATGLKYRDVILQKGNTEKPLDLLKQFLGREPSNEAFLRSIGF